MGYRGVLSTCWPLGGRLLTLIANSKARPAQETSVLWTVTDDISISAIIMALYALNIYLAFSLTRMVGGAPTGWYVIIVSFVLVLVRRGVELYADLQTNPSYPGLLDSVLSVCVALLFTVGLYMLTDTFRKRFRVTRESQNQLPETAA